MKMFALLQTFFANVLLLAACRKTTTKKNFVMEISESAVAHFKQKKALLNKINGLLH
jgi:hypothetical protein